MDKATITRVQSFGFDVYMQDEGDTYLYFTDGKRIGYMQIERLAGPYSITTVHIPNTSTGTGFRIADVGDDFTKDQLELAFVHAPDWARDRSSVKKWNDWAHFAGANTFNGKYRKIDPLS
jgi:hypothetical protein